MGEGGIELARISHRHLTDTMKCGRLRPDGAGKMHVLVRFGADRVLGRTGSPTAVGDEEYGHGWPYSDAAHRERSELGELCRLAPHRSS